MYRVKVKQQAVAASGVLLLGRLNNQNYPRFEETNRQTLNGRYNAALLILLAPK